MWKEEVNDIDHFVMRREYWQKKIQVEKIDDWQGGQMEHDGR